VQITILGTGTPAPSLKRACSGYMVEVRDDVIIMDHGPDSHRRLLESGKRATDVSHAFSRIYIMTIASIMRGSSCSAGTWVRTRYRN